MTDAGADTATHLEGHLSNLAPVPSKRAPDLGKDTIPVEPYYATSVHFRGPLLERQEDHQPRHGHAHQDVLPHTRYPTLPLPILDPLRDLAKMPLPTALLDRVLRIWMVIQTMMLIHLFLSPLLLQIPIRFQSKLLHGMFEALLKQN